MATDNSNIDRSAPNGSNIGGAGSSACAAEGYCQGNQITAQGNHRGGIGTHKDLRGGSANAESGYNQGNQIDAKVGENGGQTVAGETMGKAARTSGGPAASQSANGYNQGAQFAARGK